MESFVAEAMRREYGQQKSSPEALIQRLNAGETAEDIAASFTNPDEIALIGANLAGRDDENSAILAESFLHRGVELSRQASPRPDRGSTTDDENMPQIHRAA